MGLWSWMFGDISIISGIWSNWASFLVSTLWIVSELWSNGSNKCYHTLCFWYPSRPIDHSNNFPAIPTGSGNFKITPPSYTLRELVPHQHFSVLPEWSPRCTPPGEIIEDFPARPDIGKNQTTGASFKHIVQDIVSIPVDFKCSHDKRVIYIWCVTDNFTWHNGDTIFYSLTYLFAYFLQVIHYKSRETAKG